VDTSITYVDELKGAIQKRYYVLENFTADIDLGSARENLDFYVNTGVIIPIRTISIDENSIFTTNSQKYQARFGAGEYIDTGDGRLFITATPFTPFTLDLDTYIRFKFLLEVDPTTPAITKPLFRLNEGDTTEFVENGKKVQYEVLRSFTPTYNPEIYFGLLKKTTGSVNRVSFYDSDYNYEDTLVDSNGEIYKVIRPFSPEGETLKELAALGYVQKLVTEVDKVQTGNSFVTVPGGFNISVKRDGIATSKFYVSEDGDTFPLYFGEALF